MSKAFAEKIIDSMVNDEGRCGERGLSEKQFDILLPHLEKTDEMAEGKWEGEFKTVYFWGEAFAGKIGKYDVRIEKHWHFHFGYNVSEIKLRDRDEYEQELAAERKRKEMWDFSKSEFIAQPKKRLDMVLTLINDYEYEGTRFSYYDTSRCHIYTFRDEKGNCVIWKTKNAILRDWEDGDGHFHTTMAEVGDKVTMRATVKEHSEYHGIHQTVINRPTIKDIEKAE